MYIKTIDSLSLASNIKPNTTTNEENLQENFFNFNAKNFDFFATETEHSDEVEQPQDISLLRERKLQELTEKVLLRKIYRQMVMNRHTQDHLPLSQIQEKLEEDDLPLKVLQDKLKQKENSSIYTTIRENINFLLYNDKNYDVWDDAIIGHLMNLVETIGVEINQDENSGESINDTKESAPKVDRQLINRVVNEVINEVMREEEFKKRSSHLNDTFTKGSTKVTTDKETIVAESSTATTVAIENNAMKNIGKNTVKNIEKNTVKNIKNIEKNTVKNIEKSTVKNIEKNTVKNIEKSTVKNIDKNTVNNNIDKNTVKNIEKYTVKNKNIGKNTVKNNTSTKIENNVATNNATMDIDIEHVKNVKNDITDDIQENIQEDTNLESRKIAEEIINFGETINVAESLLPSGNLMNDNASFKSTRSVKRKFRRSIFSLGQSSTSSNDKNPDQTHNSLKRHVSDLSRRGSIHSKKSYDNDLSRRSSISSKFSFSANTDVIIEEQNEDDFNHNKFFKRNPSTRKSLQFFKNILKNNQNSPLANNEECFLSSREIREKYYQQFDGVKPDQRVYPKTIGTAGGRSDPGYSNFYLSMPNGQWMVRTRTASRKITGTQYVEKEFI
ncbi:9668_t:CDS:2 [Rhizophagus irregularis]|nr:9668_t:CDS:2 [Rhizophagus irregularis]